MMPALFGIGILYFIIHVIVWVLVIWFVIWLLRGIFGHPMHGGRRHFMNMDRSMNTLRERYAKGEITKEQFEQMKKDLE